MFVRSVPRRRTVRILQTRVFQLPFPSFQEMKARLVLPHITIHKPQPQVMDESVFVYDSFSARWRSIPYNVKLLKVDSSLSKIADCVCRNRKRLQRIDFFQAGKLEKIGNKAFQRCICLLSINLVGTATEVIKQDAFRYCSGLSYVIFNRELREIAEGAFEACTSLRTVDFSNCKQLKKIDYGAFCDCRALKRVTVPSTITYVAFSSFDEDYLEFIGVESTIALPLAIRLSTAYPYSTPTISMDLLTYLYSFRRIQSSDLLLPHDAYYDEEKEEPHLWTDDEVKLQEIQRAYPETIRRLVFWCIEKGSILRK
jgi:hypothetical protein